MGENRVVYALTANFVFAKVRIFCNIQNLLFTADSSSCTAPGYSLHPVLGCIKLSTSTTALTPEQWVAKCAEDGGKLILINSATENQALVDFLSKLVVDHYNIFGNVSYR